jgi:hypothetical protein
MEPGMVAYTYNLLALGRQKQKDQKFKASHGLHREFKASLIYIARSVSKQTNNTFLHGGMRDWAFSACLEAEGGTDT